jgi:hypothetical protein
MLAPDDLAKGREVFDENSEGPNAKVACRPQICMRQIGQARWGLIGR